MDLEKAYELAKAYLMEMFEIPEEKIHIKARLYQDLELDSIDALDMIVALESEHEMEVVEEELKKIRTVKDMADYIIRHFPS